MENHVTNAQHREKARQALNNQWGMMAWIVLLSVIINLVIGGIVNSVFTEETTGANIANFLLNNLVYFALQYGLLYAALQVLQGKKARPEMLVQAFQKEHYVPMVAIHFIQYVIERILFSIALLPFMGLFGASFYFNMILNGNVNDFDIYFTNNAAWVLAILLASFLIVVITLFLSGIFNFAVWIQFENPSLRGLASLKEALRLMKGRYVQYVMLQLSFIGWFFIGLLTMGIGLFWITPYQNVALASFYETAVAEQELI